MRSPCSWKSLIFTIWYLYSYYVPYILLERWRSRGPARCLLMYYPWLFSWTHSPRRAKDRQNGWMQPPHQPTIPAIEHMHKFTWLWTHVTCHRSAFAKEILKQRTEEARNITNSRGPNMFHTTIVFVFEIEADIGMVNQVCPNAWKIADNRDILTLELICRTNTWEQQEL